MHDPLEELLAPRPSPPVPAELFPLTVRALRRARRRQRVAQVTSLLACAAAGASVKGSATSPTRAAGIPATSRHAARPNTIRINTPLDLDRFRLNQPET